MEAWLLGTAAIQAAITELLKRLLPLDLIPERHQERAKIAISGLASVIVTFGQVGVDKLPTSPWAAWLIAWLAGSGLYTAARGTSGLRDRAAGLAIRVTGKD